MTSVGRTGRSMPLIPGGINLAALDNAIEQVEFEQFMEDGDAQNHEEPRSPTSVASAGSAGNGVHELAIFKPGNESEKSAGKDSNASATTLTTSSIITGMRKMSLAAIETRSPLVSSSPPPPRVSEEEEEDFMVAPKMPVSKAPRLKIFIENNMEAILAFGTDSMVKGPVRMASSLKLEGAAHVPNSTPAPSGPAALSMPQIPLITNFITGNFKTIIGNSRKDQLDRHVTGTANHLLQRPLPSPFDEVYRADTLTLIIRKFHVPKNVAVKSNFITNKPEGDVVKNAQVTLKIRNLELKTPLIEELPLDQDIKIRFQFPVSYHAILFDHIILVLKHDDLIQSRTRVPLAMMRPMELDAASRLKGTLPIKMKSYEDYKNVKSTRKGNLGMTQAIRLDDFGTATVDWAFSYTGEQALENRKGPLGEKGFWHISDVEKWLLDGVEPPHDVMPKSAAGKAGPTTSPRDSTHESDAGSPSISPKMSFGNLAKGAEDSPTTTSALPGPVSATSAAEIVEDPRKRVLKRSTDSTAALSREQSVSSISTLPQSPSSGSFGSTRKVGRSATTTGAKKALIKSTADSSDPHRGFVRVQTIVGEKTDDAEESEKELPSGTLPRAKKDSDSPTEESHHKKAKQAKALGEIEPVWKGLQSGIRLNLRSVKFLVSAFQTVRKMLVQAPEPPYVDRDVRRQAVRMDRVREARWWLKFSVAAYEQSSAAPFLLPKHARKANIGMVSRFLGINEQEMLWWQEQEGSFTSKFFVCWIAEKKSLVIAVRGTAGVQEALADLVSYFAAADRMLSFSNPLPPLIRTANISPSGKASLTRASSSLPPTSTTNSDKTSWTGLQNIRRSASSARVTAMAARSLPSFQSFCGTI